MFDKAAELDFLYKLFQQLASTFVKRYFLVEVFKCLYLNQQQVLGYN